MIGQGPSTPAAPFIGFSAALGLGYLLAPDDLSVQFAWGDQPGAVNYIAAYGSQTGIEPTLLASGSDSNISLGLVAQGTGAINIGNGSGQLGAFLDPGGIVAAWPTFTPGLNGVVPQVIFSSIANPSYANISASLQGVGVAGAGLGIGHTLSNTGTYAAGRSCTASGYSAGALGTACRATGFYSLSVGQYAFDNGQSKLVYQCALLGATLGANQSAKQVLVGQTTSTTPVVLTTSGTALTSINSIAPQNNGVSLFSIRVVAFDVTTPANRAYWTLTGAVYRGASASTVVLDFSTGTSAPTNAFGTTTGWAVALAANTSLGVISLTATGPASDTVRWCAVAEIVEVVAG